MSGQYAYISWYSITELDLDNVADDQLLGIDVQLLAVTQYDRELNTASM